MKNKINIIFIVVLIILVVGIIFLCIKNNLLKNELINSKNSSLQSTKNMEENINNTSEKITEEQAIKIVEDYRINTLLDTTNSYRFREIKEETVNMENRYLTVNGNYLINIEKSSENVYAVYYSLDDNTDKFTGYVDIDSGKLLGVHGEGV
jgi:uncharacterized membrane protein YhiD involved in acid resistance